MTQVSPETLAGEGHGTAVRTFVIADLRGYSTFTRERGHEAAATLAARFVDLADDAIEAKGGRIVEIRGDQVLAVFGSPLPAVRAAVELQLACREEGAEDPAQALSAGVGVDVGESIRADEQYHASALNMAARLCARAVAGEVLITRAVAALCTDDDLDLEERGLAEFKGFDRPVQVVSVTTRHGASRPPQAAAGEPAPLPPELDPLTPIVGRDRELHWLRGTWRQVRRGHGRVVFVSGPAQIGKTRLAAGLAGEVQRMGGRIRFAGPGGTATADALRQIRDLAGVMEPTLLVLDDLDDAGDAPVAALSDADVVTAARPAMVLCVLRDPADTPNLAGLLARVDRDGNGHRRLGSLEPDAVQEVVRLYAGEDLTAVPIESILRASEGVPGRVHEVMSEWARNEASRRLAAAAEYLAVGRTQRSVDLGFANNVIELGLGRRFTVEESRPGQDAFCPYKGLASFQKEDAAYFFGRERLVGELAARTVQVGLLGVIGTSGSGKSSLVSAGLLPSLRAGLLPGSERWRHVTMRPGEHPLYALHAKLATLEPNGNAGPLQTVVGSISAEQRLVLFVDQFEELLTTCRDEGERAAFVAELVEAATSAPERIVVVVALRGDFYGESAAFPALGELLSANHILVGPMSRDELHRSIELPARRVGLRVESALVDALVAEVAEEPGGLPLLSTALVELWQQRTDGWLRIEAYEHMGGVKGAVARLAESTYEHLSEVQQEAARHIFLRLAGSGEGGAVTRRRVLVAEFDVGIDLIAAAVIALLTEDRLLTMSDGSVEVAHEALFREWPRLRGWLEEDSDGRQVHRNLIQSARQWNDGGREDAELYRGTRLSAALDWSSVHSQELNELERTFVSASRGASERESKRIRRTNRRLRGLLAGVAIFLVVALIAGGIALVQRGHAQRAATVALSQSLGERGILLPRLDTGLLLATAGIGLDDSARTRSDLLATLLRSPSATGIFVVGTNGTRPEAIAVSPDGRTLAVINILHRLTFYDTQTRKPIGKQILLKDLGFIAFTPDGSMLAVQPGSGPIELYDSGTHGLIRTLPADPNGAGLFGFSPDGRLAYATGSDDQGDYLVRWDTSNGRRHPPVRMKAPQSNVAIAAKSGQVVFATMDSGGRLDVLDGTTMAVEHSIRLPVPGGQFYSVAVTPDGKTAAIMGNGTGGAVRFIDLGTGLGTVGSGALGPLGSGMFTPDGRGFLSTSANASSVGDVLVWDVASARVLQTLTGQHGNANTNFPSMAMDASGRTLYTDNFDGTVFAWDLSGTRGFGRPFTTGRGGWSDPYGGYSYPFFSVSPDGTEIAVTESGGVVNIIDLASASITASFHVPGDSSVYQPEFSPDGTELLVSPGPQEDGTVTLWSLTTSAPTLVRSFSGLANFPCTFDDCPAGVGPAPWATFSPDGKWIAGLDVFKDGTDSHLIEWNTATGTKRASPVDLHAAAANAGDVAYSADGSTIATTPGKDVVIFDAATLKVVRRFTPDALGAQMLAYSPDGTKLAIVSYSGMVRLWDTTTWKQIGDVLSFAGPGSTVAFDPTGSELASTGYDGTTRIWSVPSLEQIGTTLPGLPGTEDSLAAASAFAGQGPNARIVVVYADGKAIEWPASVSAWKRQACTVAGRNLTRAEWQLYLPGRPYEKVCPKL